MDVTQRSALTQGNEDAQIVTLTVWQTDSLELQAIILKHLVQWATLFAKKNGEYQDGNGSAFTLGERGQFSDMYRKMIKLKAALWDGHEDQLSTESVEEILHDMIGHCFLTLEMRRRADVLASVPSGGEATVIRPKLKPRFTQSDPDISPALRALIDEIPASELDQQEASGEDISKARAILKERLYKLHQPWCDLDTNHFGPCEKRTPDKDGHGIKSDGIRFHNVEDEGFSEDSHI